MPPEAIAIWPDNVAAVRVFAAIQTQWTIGPAGPIGLRYEVLPVVFDLLEIHEDRPDLFDALRVMESAALGELHRQHRQR